MKTYRFETSTTQKPLCYSQEFSTMHDCKATLKKYLKEHPEENAKIYVIDNGFGHLKEEIRGKV